MIRLNKASLHLFQYLVRLSAGRDEEKGWREEATEKSKIRYRERSMERTQRMQCLQAAVYLQPQMHLTSKDLKAINIYIRWFVLDLE